MAIHGLHGHSRESWETAGGEKRIWLQDVFTFRSAKIGRVIMYGYNANDSSGSCFTSQGIHREAEALLAQLLVLRDESVKVSISISNLQG